MADKFQLKAIISAVDKITPTLKGVQRAARMTNKTLRDIGGAGRSLMGSLGLPAGLAFGSVIYGATRAANAVMQFAGGIQDAADRTGSGVTGYQLLTNMLESVGGSAEDAEMAFTQFNKGVANAAAGTDKSFSGLLHKLHIPLKDAQGNVRSLTDMMPELADAFAKNTDPTMRTRMALEFWGKSGTKMIPIMTGGRKALAAYNTEQERLGTIVSDKSIGALDDMGDSLGVLNKQVKVQLTEGLARMVPAIMPIIKSMSEWIANNKELIQTTISKTLTDIAVALKGVDWVAFAKGIGDVIRGIGSFIETMGGMKNVLIALGVLWLAGPLSAIFSMIGAVGRLGMVLFTLVGGFGGIGSALLMVGKIFAFVGRLFLFNPIGLAVTAIAAAAYLVYANWDTIKGWFVSFFDWMGGKVAQIGEWFRGLVPDWARKMFGGGAVAVNVNHTAGVSTTSKVVQASAKAAAPVAAAQYGTNSPAPEKTAQTKTSRAPTPLIRSGALAMAGGNFQLNGEMMVRFENAPAGMRVAPGKTNQPGVGFNPDVGYRSLSLVG
ncbi:MAG: hypothetical protein Q7T29_16200 [Gallionella sp.]|nr:hypothetical protein [Gallionella sp.]